MKENHSYDNYFGMLEKGDGFTLAPDGSPLNSNPDRQGRPVRAHHLGLPLNPSFHLNQTWNDSHRQWNGGGIGGFVPPARNEGPLGKLHRNHPPGYYSLSRAPSDRDT